LDSTIGPKIIPSKTGGIGNSAFVIKYPNTPNKMVVQISKTLLRIEYEPTMASTKTKVVTIFLGSANTLAKIRAPKSPNTSIAAGVWILCLYFMGLNLSNRQIAKELDLCVSDVQEMTTQLREGIAAKRPEVCFEGEVEFDEVYVIAGHKGNPEEVKKRIVKEEEIGSKEHEVEEH
jgi:hypothetical protein